MIWQHGVTTAADGSTTALGHRWLPCHTMEFALPPRDLRSNADVSPDDQQPLLDNALRRRWTEAADAGVCRYRLTCLLTKILVGKYRFVAQVKIEFCVFHKPLETPITLTPLVEFE